MNRKGMEPPMLFAETANVIQADWQSLAALGSILGGAIVGAAKILAMQLANTTAIAAEQHAHSRQDTKEARDENRTLAQAIFNIQAESVKALTGVQAEVKRIVDRMDNQERRFADAE